MQSGMLQSQLFTKTRKEAPKGEVSLNAQLLIRAGYIHKEMAGVYTFLPLGLRVLNKIADIIRDEMNALGAQEVFMTTLQSKELWEKTGRWSDDFVDNWFKTNLANGTELGLGLTHEEPLSNILTNYISSYKDLPQYVYQIQTKFRNELRAKSGIMRGREFMMKDLYSFNTSLEEQDVFYKKAQDAYMNIYDRCGIGDRTFLTFASGGIFSKYSHEFQTLSEAGEDTIYLNRETGIAVNKEVYTDEVLENLGMKRDQLEERKSIEVGNIFKQGTKYTEPLNLTFKDENGEKQPVYLGAYGIGLGRIMGTAVEVLSDDAGIVWPKEIAPFSHHILRLGDDQAVVAATDDLYRKLQAAGHEVLYDDRAKVGPGAKFADSDLIGIPTRVVVSAKTVEAGTFEVKDRATGGTQMLSEEQLLKQ